MADPLSPFGPGCSTASTDDLSTSATSDTSPLPGTGLSAFHSVAPQKLRADGKPMQKRGPKPRNQPPLNRKQELARRAQRSHKERKELYVKALEQEVFQLKNDMSILSSGYESLEAENQQFKANIGALSSRNAQLEDENRKLRQLLEQHGASWPVSQGVGEFVTVPEPSPQITTPSSIKTGEAGTTSAQAGSQFLPGKTEQGGLDYEQIGIDFVLSFEDICLLHMSADAAGSQLYGHALMASCQPGVYPESSGDVPFEPVKTPAAVHDHSHSLTKSSFESLLHHSHRLNLDGEVTPVMAWQMLVELPRFSEFTVEDIERIRSALSGKARCHGFGAVFEEFEVRDILDNFVPSKDLAASGISNETANVQY
jgi:hypothetical protein